MRRFFTITLLAALLLTAVNSPSAQQRAAAPAGHEARAGTPGSPAADEDFALANQELTKLTRRLGTDRKFAKRFIEAARARDRAKTGALLKEAGVRGDIKVEAGGVSGGDQASNLTITFCLGPICITIIITRNAAS
jgi:hypothetical protein